MNGTEIKYTLEGDQVLFELNGDVELRYFYDAAGAPIAFSMGSDPVLYLYRKNLQGDVTGVYSGSTGALLVSYFYDAWGKVTKTDVAETPESGDVFNYNPYLYRGYRYDSETELYYLNSRYYDPEIGRFINADTFVSSERSVLSANVFAYTKNNPTNKQDQNGKHPLGILELYDKKIIHHIVVKQCSARYGWAREVYVKKNWRRGYIDLLDPKENEFYEVKSEKESKKNRTIRQMEKYTQSTIQNTIGNRLKTPKVEIGSIVKGGGKEPVEDSFPYGIYDVSYSLASPGLIVYTWSLNTERALALATAEVITALIVLFPEAASVLAPGVLGVIQ